jgi:hypothetical protein
MGKGRRNVRVQRNQPSDKPTQPPTYTKPRAVSLAETLASSELVSVHDGHQDHGGGSAHIVVAERPQMQFAGNVQTADFRELGTAVASPWTSWLGREYNNVLRGHSGLRKYDEMRRSDSTVAGTLKLAKTPILGARWYMEPASQSPRDVNVAKKIWWNLTEGMSTSWPQFLTEALLMLDFGHYLFEKVFEAGNPNAPVGMGITWKKFAPRHPLDVTEWLTDGNGGPAGIRMMNPGGVMAGQEIAIPISKLLVFTNQKEAGDMTGISLLRPAFKPWYFKSQLEKIDAIQKERHGIGIPIIKLPVGYKPADKILAQNLGRNLRTNEQAHIVLPPMWEIMFADLKGQPVNVLDSIKYHNGEIVKNILAPFMEPQAKAGKDDDRILFLKAARFAADIVVDVINKYAIPELVDYNWQRVGYPKICARRIGEQADWRTMSFAIRNMVGAGIIRPDDRLEENIREEMDLPMADPATLRLPPTPQNGAAGGPAPVPPGGQANTPTPPGPGRAGPPRQAPVPQVGVPRPNAGIDRSGG